ncbi:ABC transporter ATP-binding protein [Alkalihalobacillus sp. 1P02AB]|uniref:ABC transporter ATP-binding protein n=1 Tax=Alkalihalobacillus sp. 1P02AB TaxID=3132260 RepID=UPI0039A5A240
MEKAICAKQMNVHIGSFTLNNINVEIPKGKMTAIVGPNGSGKSTFLKVISRLVKPEFGEVMIEQKELDAYKAREFAQTLAMMPQSKQTLPNLTVKELIQYGRSPYKRFFEHQANIEDQEIVEWAMAITGTAKHKERFFHTLSGGEQQKVRIALALAQKTNILLLDEPTTFLDITHQLEVMELLEEVNVNHGMTIVMVLHELQQAAAYCHHLIAMQKGRVVSTGPPIEMLTPLFLKEIYQIEAKIIYEDNYPLIVPLKGQYNLSQQKQAL